MGTPMPGIWVANLVGAQKIPNNLHQTVWFHRKPKKYIIKIGRYTSRVFLQRQIWTVNYYVKKLVKKSQLSKQTLVFLLSSRQNVNAKMNYFCNIITSVCFDFQTLRHHQVIGNWV